VDKEAAKTASEAVEADLATALGAPSLDMESLLNRASQRAVQNYRRKLRTRSRNKQARRSRKANR
jgi:hypothetical protein